MKNTLRIIALLIGILLFLGFVADPLRQRFGWSESSLGWMGLGFSYAMFWWLFNLPSPLSFFKGQPRRIVLLRILGAGLVSAGVVLTWGNIAGDLQTLPFAGSILIVLGIAELIILGKVDIKALLARFEAR